MRFTSRKARLKLWHAYSAGLCGGGSAHHSTLVVCNMAKQEIQCVDPMPGCYFWYSPVPRGPPRKENVIRHFTGPAKFSKSPGSVKKIDIYVRPFCKFSARGYVHDAWWERSGSGWISVSLYRMVRCAESVVGVKQGRGENEEKLAGLRSCWSWVSDLGISAGGSFAGHKAVCRT